MNQTVIKKKLQIVTDQVSIVKKLQILNMNYSQSLINLNYLRQILLRLEILVLIFEVGITTKGTDENLTGSIKLTI